LDNFGDRCWVTRYGIRDADEVDQYIASFYWAFQTVTTVGYGDIPPETTLEKIVCVSWMMAGVLFYSFTIGNLSTILANIDRRSQLLKVIDYFLPKRIEQNQCI
jgi:Ion channel.